MGENTLEQPISKNTEMVIGLRLSVWGFLYRAIRSLGGEMNARHNVELFSREKLSVAISVLRTLDSC